MPRDRLPDRRPAETRRLEFGRSDGTEAVYHATIGFDLVTATPREIFLAGAKDGTDMMSILTDTAVLISVALQYGVPVSAMAKSISRIPIDEDGPPIKPTSIIGAALDLLATYETEGQP